MVEKPINHNRILCNIFVTNPTGNVIKPACHPTASNAMREA